MVGRIVVNLFGPPNSGKTVASASIFAKLKKKHIDAVLIPEFATMKAIEENTKAFKNQLFIWANQQYQIFCGYQHARVVLTDSPILLGAIYNSERPSLCSVIMEEHQRYNNLNIMMELSDDYPYSMVARVHSYTESQGIGRQMISLLESNDIPFLYYNETTEDEIVDLIMGALE
ncbi:MAG: hypothetical protein KY428_07640 [Bacteroidetes bacterium]|nr:hypothetical protein [Bacteroidota bacterium]